MSVAEMKGGVSGAGSSLNIVLVLHSNISGFYQTPQGLCGWQT